MIGRNNARTGWLLWIAGFCVLLPIAVVLVWSVTDRWGWPELIPQAVSLRGIRELASSGTLRVLWSSILISAAVALLSVAVGILTARAIVFDPFPGRDWIVFGSMLPLIVPGTVFGMGIHLIFVRIGLSDTIPGVILVHLICVLPYSVSILTDSTRVVGQKLEEQARVLGADPLRAFRSVTFPALMPACISVLAMSYLISFSQYFLTLLIGGGRVRTFTVLMVPFLQGGDRTLAGAYTSVFLGVTLAVFLVFHTVTKKWILPQVSESEKGEVAD